MALTDKKHIKVNGSPTEFGQPVVDSDLNEELKSFEEHEQTDPQILTAGVEIDITCDGAEKSVIKPDTITPIWDITTSNGTLIANAFYDISVVINLTGTANNTTVIIGFENISNPSDRFERELLLERTGVPVTLDANFKFFSDGSVFKITALSDKNATINDVVVVGKREY